MTDSIRPFAAHSSVRTARGSRRSSRRRVWGPFRFESLEDRALPSTVTSTGDSGPNTLRAAILAVNAGNDPGPITFQIAGTGAHTISLLSPLPALNVPVVIDATSQAGYAGKPLIELNGSGAGPGAFGLVIAGGGSTVEGLAIDQFDGANLVLQGGGGNVVQSNFIGTNAAGTSAFGVSGAGILIQGGSSGNLIGTNADGVNDAAERNVVSGVAGVGILVTGTGTRDNQIAGNLVGTDVSGTRPLGNGSHGIELDTDGNLVGGELAAQGNTIAANGGAGVWVAPSGTQNRIVGNRIGTDITGTKKLGNLAGGLILDGTATTVGGTTTGARNLISANLGPGILIDTGSSANVVQGNILGANIAGTIALSNVGGGIVDQGDYNTLGGLTAGAGNLISGNVQAGIDLYGASFDLVAGNLIGTTISGTSALGNRDSGIRIEGGAFGNIVGAAGIGANIIAFNNALNLFGGGGVVVADFSSSGNLIEFNAIHDNNGLGIDLGGDGVTANTSTNDGTGPNGRQPYPVLTSVAPSGGQTTVSGTVSGPAGASFVLDFYINAAADPSGFGEGQTYVGSSPTLSFGLDGTATFSVVLPVALASGQCLSATATGPAGTSEFSKDATAQLVPVVTWAAPAPIVYGTPLGTAQLDATASVPGTFTYTPVAGTVLHAVAGQSLTVLFTPDDPVAYASVTSTVPIQVLKATATFTMLAAPAATYGDPTVTLSGQVGGGLVVPSGIVTITFAGMTRMPAIDPSGHFEAVFPTATLPASTTPYPITYAYNGSTDFLGVTDATQGVIVNRRPLSVAANDASVPYGSPVPTLSGTLTGVQNGDDANGGLVVAYGVPGTPASLHVGSYPIVPVVSGAAIGNYDVTLIDASLAVTPAALTIQADDQLKVFGAPLPGLSVSYTGFVNGDTPTSLTSPPTVATTATASSPVAGGPYPITPSGAVDPDYQIAYVSGSLTVSAASSAIQLVSTPTAPGQPITLTATASAIAPGAGAPTGTIGFYEGATLLASAPMSGGSASLLVPPLAAGTHPLKAVYTGDGNFLGATSPTLVETIAGSVSSVYVLDAKARGALSLSGNALLNIPGALIVDSSSTVAVRVGGDAGLSAGSITLVGGYRVSGHASLVPDPITGAPATPDPFAGLAAPTAGQAGPFRGAIHLSGNARLTISPGVYTEINVSGNARLTLNPGLYILAGGGLTLSGNARLAGSGVLIDNAGHWGASAITIAGNASVSLTPLSTGPYAGIVIFQGLDNPQPLSIGGAALAGFGGTIYAPTALLSITGNGPATLASAVVDRIQVGGDGQGDDNSAGFPNGPCSAGYDLLVAFDPAWLDDLTLGHFDGSDDGNARDRNGKASH